MSFKGISFYGMNKVAESGGPSLPPFEGYGFIFGGGNAQTSNTFRKINESGGQEWQNDPLTNDAVITDVTVSSYNYVYAVGGNGNIYYDIVKMNISDGSAVWSKTIGGGSWTSGGSYAGLGISIDPDENVWMVGLTASGGSAPYGGSIYKLDSDGNVLFSYLRTATDYFIGCATDMSGNVYVGAQRATTTKSLYKYNSAGTEQWSVDHGGIMRAIAVPLDGTYVCAGGDRVSSVTWRKYDSSGSLLYSKDTNGMLGGVKGIFVDNVNGYIYVTNESTPNLRKYAEDGTLLWSYSMSCSLCRSYSVTIAGATGGSYLYTAQQQEGMKKWTDANPPVQQWQYDAGADYTLIHMANFPLPYGRDSIQ